MTSRRSFLTGLASLPAIPVVALLPLPDPRIAEALPDPRIAEARRILTDSQTMWSYPKGVRSLHIRMVGRGGGGSAEDFDLRINSPAKFYTYTVGKK